MNSIGNRAVGQVIESTDFNIVAVPEFPISAAVVSATVIGFIVVIMRAKGSSIGNSGSGSSLFGTKDAL